MISLQFCHGRWGSRAHNWSRGEGSSLSSFSLLKPQPVGGAPEGAGLLTSQHQGLWELGLQHLPVLIHPWTLSGGPGPLHPTPPHPHFAPVLSPPPCPVSRCPMTCLPAPHWPAWEHLPLFGQAAPGQASTPSPAPAGLSLSLRLFEVWLWGPGGRRFKRTFWLSHFLTAPGL